MSSILTFCLLIGSAVAFGAGNIPSFGQLEGAAYRHGDIEDILLQMIMIPGSHALFNFNPLSAAGKKFSALVCSTPNFLMILTDRRECETRLLWELVSASTAGAETGVVMKKVERLFSINRCQHTPETR